MGPRRVPLWLLPPLAALAAYANGLHGSFQFDDYNVIVMEPRVHSFSAWAANLMEGGIRPLLKASYLMNWSIAPNAPFGFHLFNILVHAANAALVFFLARNLARRYAPAWGESAEPFALAVALIFALHPLQTEAVTYISGRSVSLAAFFYLAALLAYIEWAGAERGIRLASPVLFVCAVATRETALTLPVGLLLYEAFAPDRVGWRIIFRRQAAHWGILAALAAVVLTNKNYLYLLRYAFDLRSAAESFFSQVHGVTHVLSHLVLLDGLNIDPDLRTVAAPSPSTFLLAALLIAPPAAAAITARKNPLFGFGIFWFYLQMLPANSFIPRTDIANERHLYLSMAGLCIAAGALAMHYRERWRQNRRAAFTGFALLLCLLAAFTARRNLAYASEIALWEDTVKKSPLKARPHGNLGYAYYLAGRREEAEREYRAALQCDPAFFKARANLRRLEKNAYPTGA